MNSKYSAGIVLGQRSLREVNDRTLKVCGHLLGTISSTAHNISCIRQLQFLLTTKKTSRRQPNIIESFCRSIFRGCDDNKHMTTRHRDNWTAWLLVNLNIIASQGDQISVQVFKSYLEALRSRVSNGTLPSPKTIDTWSMPDLNRHADNAKMLRARHLAGEFNSQAWRGGCLGLHR